MTDINDIKRISFDLDQTICKLKRPEQKYEDVEPLPGAVETLQELKKQGWYIIISTARNQRTYNHNIGAVMAKQIPIVSEWLKKWDIPFDEIWMKPHVSWFVDDKAIEFVSWNKLKEELSQRIIEEKINQWNVSNSKQELHKFLGWTFEEYKNYVETNKIPNKDKII